jgi:Family of unknown function (DUF6055)
LAISLGMRRFLALLTIGAAVFAAPAAAAPKDRAVPSPGQAKHALEKVKQLQKGEGVQTGRELTPALAELYAALPSLSGADRQQAESILARPDDSQKDPEDTHKWSGSEALLSPRCTVHFCVHYTTNSGPDNSTGSYAQQMANLFETEVYPCENGTAPTACGGKPGLGWRDAASDGTLGRDGRVDIYVEDLYTSERVFGYVAVDPGQPQDPAVPHSAYMVMDKDYTRYGDGTAASGLAAERVTAAHEYNHVLQNAYDYLEDSWMFEATAVYMEDKVYPDNNDYLHYVDAWTANAKQPLTTFSKTNLKAYGSAVWNHWLDHRFGAAAIRNAWEQSVAAADFAPGAYSSAIAALGGGGLSDEFDRFAAAVAEWDAPGSGFPDRYPDVPRDALLPAGSQTVPFALPHTTFALFDVPIPAGAPRVIRLTGTLPSGTAGAIALVGRTGADPAAGVVTTNLTPMPAGGTAAVSLDSPAMYGRITAVVVNSDPSRSGFDPAADDYIFTKDATGVVAALAEPGPPVPTTGSATQIRDHAASINGTVDPHLNDTTWSIQYGRTSGYGSSTAPKSLPAATVGAAPVAAPLRDLKANTTYHYRVIASNSAGVTAGDDMTFRTARDVTKPKVTVKVKRQRITRVRTRGLIYLGRCSERCRGTAEVVVRRSAARRLNLPLSLGKARLVLEPRAKSSTLRVRLGRRAKNRLRSISRGFAVTLRVRVADDSRNRTTVKRRLTLLRSAP